MRVTNTLSYQGINYDRKKVCSTGQGLSLTLTFFSLEDSSKTLVRSFVQTHSLFKASAVWCCLMGLNLHVQHLLRFLFGIGVLGPARNLQEMD